MPRLATNAANQEGAFFSLLSDPRNAKRLEDMMVKKIPFGVSGVTPGSRLDLLIRKQARNAEFRMGDADDVIALRLQKDLKAGSQDPDAPLPYPLPLRATPQRY